MVPFLKCVRSELFMIFWIRRERLSEGRRSGCVCSDKHFKPHHEMVALVRTLVRKNPFDHKLFATGITKEIFTTNEYPCCVDFPFLGQCEING